MGFVGPVSPFDSELLLEAGEVVFWLDPELVVDLILPGLASSSLEQLKKIEIEISIKVFLKIKFINNIFLLYEIMNYFLIYNFILS